MDHEKLIRMSQVISRLKSQSLLTYELRQSVVTFVFAYFWYRCCCPPVVVFHFNWLEQLTKKRYSQLLYRNRYVLTVCIPVAARIHVSAGRADIVLAS